MRKSDTRHRWPVWATLIGAWLLRPVVALAAPEEVGAPSFTGQGFRYQVGPVDERPEYRVVKLTYPSPAESPVPQNSTIPAEFYVPKDAVPGGPRRPAVICLHILDGNVELVRLTCGVLASRGIPALWFPLPYYGPRGLPEGRRALASNPKLFVGALSQSALDVRRTVDVLATRPEVDPDRIGVTGFSLGGIVAASAAAQEPRIHRVVLALAGGDLPGILAHAHEARAIRALLQSLPPAEREPLESAIAQADPLVHAAGLRERAMAGRVLMINAALDEVIPRAATEELASALGIADRVEWIEGLGHYTSVAGLPVILQRTVDYFGQDLPAGVRPGLPAEWERTSVGTPRGFLQQIVRIVGSSPAPGKCHLAEIALVATPAEGKQIDGRLFLVRGAGGRFRLECTLPSLGRYLLGQGGVPWMATEGSVLRGSRNAPAEPGDPLAFADPAIRVRGRVLVGGIAGMAMSPDSLAPLARIADDAESKGGRAIRIALAGETEATGRLVLKADGVTPAVLSADTTGLHVELRFLRWQLDGAIPDGAFDPPQGAPVVETDRDTLYRTFAGLLKLGIQQVPRRFL